MELEDLVGLHELSGVDFNNESIKATWGDSYDDCQVVNFIIDGLTYSVIENPCDGYRSCMKEIKQSPVEVENKFPDVTVYGSMNDQVLIFHDVHTNKIVLSIGTRNAHDYYPCFVSNFSPENMIINRGNG